MEATAGSGLWSARNRCTGAGQTYRNWGPHVSTGGPQDDDTPAMLSHKSGHDWEDFTTNLPFLRIHVAKLEAGCVSGRVRLC
jgi:hypothetical protein